jgi:hypothetical protein
VAVTPTAADQHGLLRAAVLAAVSAVLTAVGHLVGGGSLPDLTVLVVLLPLLAAGFTALSARSRSAVGTVGVLGLGQLALHELIELLNPTHQVHAAHHLAGPATPNGIGMLAGHVLATLLIAAALCFADRAIAAVGAALRRVLPRRPPGLRADRPLTTLITPGAAVSLRLARALAATQGRRGPPVGC